MKPTVSELIDQQLPDGQVPDRLGEVARDPEGCQSWRNYHLIGDVIRGESLQGRCLMMQIGQRLEAEPTILAPTGSAGASVTPSPVSSLLGSDAAKSAGLFAIAASLALVAVLTLDPQSTSNVSRGQPLAAVNQAAVTEGVTATERDLAAADSAAADAFESEFGQMLVEHGEFTATSGLNGLVAYAKLVSNQQLAR